MAAGRAEKIGQILAAACEAHSALEKLRSLVRFCQNGYEAENPTLDDLEAAAKFLPDDLAAVIRDEAQKLKASKSRA